MNESSSSTDDVAGRARQAAGDTAQRLGERARETGDAVQDRVSEQVDERSTAAGDRAQQTSEAVRDMSGQLRSQGNELGARAADEVATRVERLARYLRESDGDRIMGDLENFGRRQPLVVAAVGLAAGVAAARLLKASGNRSGSRARPDGESTAGRMRATPAAPDMPRGGATG